MKYMLMLYADEKAGESIPRDQMAQAMDTLYAYQQVLTKAGVFVETAPLARSWDAKTIRMEGGTIQRREDGAFAMEGGELNVQDGPYADTREQFGGYYVIEARDMDEAMKWAAQCPAVHWGPIEVRPYHPGL